MGPKSPTRLALAAITASALAVGALPGAGAARSAACPPRSPRTIAANPWKPAQSELAPTGATRIRLCRYSGMNQHPALSLTGSRLIRGHRMIRQLVGRFDALPSPPPAAVICPMGDGSQILALLSYRRGHTVTVSFELTACNDVTNGDLYRTTANFGATNPRGQRLLAQLEQLTT